MMKRLNAEQLRKSNPSKLDLAKIKRNPIYFVLDRIIDTYNTGSLFRLADAISVKKMYLCGDMEYPPNSRIHKAAVGTENWVEWLKEKSTINTIQKLKRDGVYTVAIEQGKKAVTYKNLKPKFPVAIVIGSETGGIEKKVLEEVDTIVELPMHGINISFNTWGCAAVVSYKILESL